MTICVHSVHWSKAEDDMTWMKQTKIKIALSSGVQALWRLIVAVEACLSWNETFIMSRTLPKLNYRPTHTQQRKVLLRHKYPNCDAVSDTLGCRSWVSPNDCDIPAQAAALPPISEPMSQILTQERNDRVDCVDCRMGLAIMWWQSWRYVPRTLWCIVTLIVCQQ